MSSCHCFIPINLNVERWMTLTLSPPPLPPTEATLRLLLVMNVWIWLYHETIRRRCWWERFQDKDRRRRCCGPRMEATATRPLPPPPPPQPPRFNPILSKTSWMNAWRPWFAWFVKIAPRDFITGSSHAKVAKDSSRGQCRTKGSTRASVTVNVPSRNSSEIGVNTVVSKSVSDKEWFWLPSERIECPAEETLVPFIIFTKSSTGNTRRPPTGRRPPHPRPAPQQYLKLL